MPVRWRRHAAFSVLFALVASTSFHGLVRSTSAAVGPTIPTFQLSLGVGGSEPGNFNGPFGVAVGPSGDFYVLERYGARVQKFSSRGIYLGTWGSYGSGPGQFNAPSFIATDPSGTVYLTDSGNNRVQKFDANGAYLGQWGTLGNGNGQMNNPYAIATDAAGNVYVTEWNGHRVQKFTSAGVYITKWGTQGSGAGQFLSPSGIAVDRIGNVFVGDQNNHVQKFTNSGTYLGQWGSTGNGNAQFNNLNGMAVDPLGYVYTTEFNNNRIQKFTNDGIYVAQWGSTGAGNNQFNGLVGVASDATGNLYATDFNNHRVQKFGGAGIAFAPTRPRFVSKVYGPFSFYGITLVPDYSLMLVADRGNNCIQRIWTPTFEMLFPSWGGPQQFNSPQDVDNYQALLYVADTENNRIQRMYLDSNPNGQWGSAGSGPGQFNKAWAIDVDTNGNVYVADKLNHRIQKFTSVGGYLGQWGSFGTGNGQFQYPQGVTTDVVGNVYVADAGNNRVQKFDPNGGYLTKWGSIGSGNGQFQGIQSVATDLANNVYVVDYGNQRVQKFTTNGAYLTQWGSEGFGDGQFWVPYGIELDPQGDIYVSDGANRLQKFVVPAEIEQVSDVGNDQGRQVELRVLRCSADAPETGLTITNYEVYRRVEALPGAPGGTASSDGIASTRPAETQLAGWSYLGSFPAHGESEYSIVVPTLADANASSAYYTAYMVRAATANPFIYADSEAEYGYSLDNIPPGTPESFFSSYALGATKLHWVPSTASDFAGYRIYRGNSASFIPGPATFLATVPDTGYADAGPPGFHYKLAAVDVNGNVSPYALVGPSGTIDVPSAAPIAFALEGVRPNPSSGRELAVQFTLVSDAPAGLELIDVAGRRVAYREVGTLGAGAHSVKLAEGRRVHAGLYFLRLRQGGLEKTTRVTVLE